MIIQLHILLTGMLACQRRVLADRRGEHGSVTLEQVILALGLFLLATAVLAGIAAAVNSRLGQIK
jgi:hypothetical protein